MPKYIYKHRRGTVSQWADHSTTVPHEGEIVIEIDDVNGLHKLKIGDGVHTYAELAYLKAGDEIVSQVLAEVKPRIVTVELTTNWSQASDGKYSQVIALENITNHSRLDLQPTADMLAEFKQLGLVFVTENNGGTITVYSVGNMPLKAYTMQATIIETECDGDGMPVVGIPVGAPAAQADWNQTATNSPEFIKNKPTLGALASKDEVAKTDLTAAVQASLNKADTAIQSVDGLATEDYVDQAITDHTLIGSTTELTPTDVVEAVATGRNVILAHTDATFGLLAANHFTFSPTDQTVLATSIVPYGDGYVAYALIGFLSSNTWNSMYTIVAEQEKVDAAIAELSEGFGNVIFQMYGSDLDTEVETAPTIRQIANDEATTALNAAKEYTGTYVDEKVAGLVDSSPETLNTLNELAAALGDDPNFATTVATEIGKKVDKVSGKGLSTNDYTTAEKNKLAGIAEGANKTVVDSALSSTSTNPVQNKVINSALAGKVDTSTTVNGHALSGNVTVTKSDVGLGNVDNTSDANKPVSTAQQTAINEAVNTAKTYTDTVAEGKADKSQAIFYIQGGGTTDTTNKKATWTGSHSDITEYYDGLMIAYKVGTAGSTTTTLNINNLGAVKVVRNVTTAVSTVYGVDAIVLLTYTTDSSGTSYWKVADYDSDTKTRSSNKADTKMYIIGASSQSTSGQTTYSNSKCYIGADNCLYSDGKKVITASDLPEDAKAFYITVTPQSNERYTIDKTAKEVVEACDAGYSLYAVYGQSENNSAASAVHSLTAYRYGQPEGAPEGAMEFYFEFSLSNISSVSGSAGISETMIVISGDYYQENEQYTCTVRTDSLSNSVATTSSNGLMSAEDKTKLDGIENGVLMITVTDNDDGTYSSDYTYDEIVAASDKGELLVVRYGNNIFTNMVGATTASFLFAFTHIIGTTIRQKTVAISAASVVVNDAIVITALKNPKAITFTGATSATYDGSAALSVEIPAGLPTVTTSNDGAFLRVVNGAWAAVQLPNVEEGEF